MNLVVLHDVSTRDKDDDNLQQHPHRLYDVNLTVPLKDIFYISFTIKTTFLKSNFNSCYNQCPK